MRSRRPLVAFGLFATLTLAAGASAGQNLKYQFKPGETYAYSITVVGEIGQTIETTSGTIQFTVKSADGNQAQMTPLVSLSTKVKNPPSTGKGPKSIGPPRFGGPPGFGGPKLIGAREFTVDSSGKVLKFSGETSLPWLLGSAEEFVVEPLSATGENRWQRDRDLVLREGGRSSDFGPPRTTNETNTAAKESATYEITNTSGSNVTVKKTYEFKTLGQTGTAPRIQLDGTGEMVFDTQAGLIKAGEFKGAIVVNQNNITVKIPVTASYKLMSTEEVATLKKQRDELTAKAVKAAKEAATPKEVSDSDIDQALIELKSEDQFKLRRGADKLAKAVPVESRRDEVAAALAGALKDRDDFARKSAANALKVWGTSKNVPDLIDATRDTDIFVRYAAIEALGNMKDTKGAEAVAKLMPELRVRMEATKSLKAMGPVAEKAVQTLLKDREWVVRMDACKILAEIGTNASLQSLKSAQADSNRLVANEAAKAVQAISTRKK